LSEHYEIQWCRLVFIFSKYALPHGFHFQLADPDVWFRSATKPDVFEYYKYFLVYVDDLLVLSHKPEQIMQLLEDFIG